MKLLLYSLFVILFIAWGFYVGSGRAQSPSVVQEYFQFYCKKGVCWIAEADLNRLEDSFKWASRKLGECGSI